MVMPSSGVITLEQLRQEVNAVLPNIYDLPQANFSLGGKAARVTASKPSGQIKMSDLYGKTGAMIVAPITFSETPAAVYTATFGEVGSNGGMQLVMLRDGQISIRTVNSLGVLVNTGIFYGVVQGCYGLEAFARGCSIVVTREYTNGVGSTYSGGTFTPTSGWGNILLSIDFLGNATAEVRYRVDITDLYSGTLISFTTTLRLTP